MYHWTKLVYWLKYSVPQKSTLEDSWSTEKRKTLVWCEYLLKCATLSCESVVKTIQTSPWIKKELCPVRDSSPSMLLWGKLYLFRANFPRCHTFLKFVTSWLASPMLYWDRRRNQNSMFASQLRRGKLKLADLLQRSRRCRSSLSFRGKVCPCETCRVFRKFRSHRFQPWTHFFLTKKSSLPQINCPANGKAQTEALVKCCFILNNQNRSFLGVSIPFLEGHS